MTAPAPHQNKTDQVKLDTPRELSTSSKVILSLVAAGVIVLSASATAGFLYRGRILPGISVANIKLGGFSDLEATAKLQAAYQTMIDKGLAVSVGGEITTVPLSPGGATDPDLIYPLIDANIDETVNAALAIGRSNGALGRLFGPLAHLLGLKSHLSLDLKLADTRFDETIHAAFPKSETAGLPTDFAVTKADSGWNVAITPPTIGTVLDLDRAKRELTLDASDLSLGTLNIVLKERNADITIDEARALTPDVIDILNKAPYNISYKSDNGITYSYTLTAANLADWLVPKKRDNQLLISFEATKAVDWLKAIRTDIDVLPRDAQFVMTDGRVTTFVPSREGQRVDDDALIKDLETAFIEGRNKLTLSVVTAEPKLTTAATNDLGINEILGVGISNYGNSPANRRVNIKHGAEKLNGLIVQPGETLSLIEHLRPFTVEDGYLPELVIKGDEIKPEIGGGLCQIGTTTFRAAMNSGLDIAERRNHSLVVSYYNDLSNGNPGTDATIYDPAPDLKIHNDTQKAILLQTEMHTDKNELVFTFWGTNDGRSGHYTPPKVLSWTAAGEPVNKDTPTLPVGKKNCQAAHPGATTTFDYIVKKLDGTEIVRTFNSTYRALPAICLVGTGGAPEPVAPVTIE